MQAYFQYSQDYHHFNVSNLDTGGSTSLRSGDWICLNCNNFNYSFRNICNRCKYQTKNSNMELQTIMKALEASTIQNQNSLQKSQPKEVAQPRVWFSEALQTQSFCNVLFPFVSQLTVDQDITFSSLKQKKSISQLSVATQASYSDISLSDSKSNSFCWQNDSISSNDICEQETFDSYLMNILKD